MFPFEVNLLIGVLIVAIIPTYILILKKLRPVLQKNTSEQNSRKHQEKSGKKDDKAAKKSLKSVQSTHSKSECTHEFGYLRTLPKNASLPDECIRCSKALECLRYQPKKKTVRDRNPDEEHLRRRKNREED